MTLEARLAQLLAESFTVDELRRFLRTRVGAAFTDALPTPGVVGLATYAADAAERLCKKRQFTPAFADAWIAACSGYADEIRALGELAGWATPSTADAPRGGAPSDATGLGRAAGLQVLFLAASPSDQARLRLDVEFRDIDAAVRASEHRDAIRCAHHGAVRPADLPELLMRYCPHVVHFSGHGVPGGLLFVDDRGASKPVTADALRAVFGALRDNVRLVFLNACYSAHQASAIGEHIDFVVGMERAFSDNAAIQFARAFYLGLGYGRAVRTAFDTARATLMLESIPGDRIPQLLVRSGVDADVSLYPPPSG